tara:strand:+ start:126 stop:374 length:249 start_codon:yes stop_codon:yes gene_type:complete
MKTKLDLSKITSDELIEELYSRDDVWIVQFFDVDNIKHASEKKLSTKKAKEVISELKSQHYWQDKISDDLPCDINDILNNLD